MRAVADRRGRGDRASAVVFVPAAVLILLMLAGLAVDLSVAYLARHQLDDAAASAANDAVTAGLDLAAFTTRSDPWAAFRSHKRNSKIDWALPESGG